MGKKMATSYHTRPSTHLPNSKVLCASKYRYILFTCLHSMQKSKRWNFRKQHYLLQSLLEINGFWICFLKWVGCESDRKISKKNTVLPSNSIIFSIFSPLC